MCASSIPAIVVLKSSLQDVLFGLRELDHTGTDEWSGEIGGSREEEK